MPRAVSGQCDVDLCSQFWKNRVRSIFNLSFVVRIPYLVCGYILGLQTATNCFKITKTLTSGLSSRSILSLVPY